MGLGKLMIDAFGMKTKYQGLFEKFIKLGVMGLGYEQPMKTPILEDLLLRRTLKNVDFPIIFDVGANKGQYISLVHGALQGFSFQLYAFEPNAANAIKLQKQYCVDNIKIIQKGLGEKEEKLQLFKHKQDDLSTLHYISEHFDEYRNKGVTGVHEIDVTTLDNYCKQNEINFIDFLKIDTEGHEFFVLKGSSGMIKERRVKHIQFEFSELNIASRTTFFDFWSLLHPDYKIYRICKDGNYEIKKYEPLLHEIYHPINFFASLKN